MTETEQKYRVDIGFKRQVNLVTIVCKKGADKLFADIISGEKYIVFYCCEGDKTLLRTDEISFLFSKKIDASKGD